MHKRQAPDFWTQLTSKQALEYKLWAWITECRESASLLSIWWLARRDTGPAMHFWL